jgi:hypothetical protein
MTAPKKQPSPTFSHRELNGEHLLQELRELRLGQVTQKQLNACARELRTRANLSAAELSHELRTLARGTFADDPAIGALLKSWAQKVVSDADVPILASHAQRLAMTSALVDTLRRVSAGLRGGGVPR